jgi:predicted nucleic acid binding AN1-type Zn finger protein
MRCPECNKKLTLVMEASNRCRCGLTFCSGHRSPEDHRCGFDYRAVEKDKLKKTMVQIVPEKIAAI